MSEPNQESQKRRRAARVLAGQATDAADLAMLLDMLGLTAAEGRGELAPDIPAARPRESSTLLGAG